MSRGRLALALFLLAALCPAARAGGEESVLALAGPQGSGVGFAIGAGDVLVTSARLGSPVTLEGAPLSPVVTRAARGLSLWRAAAPRPALSLAPAEFMPAADQAAFLTPAPVPVRAVTRGSAPGLSGSVWIATADAPVPPGAPLVRLAERDVLGVAVGDGEQGTIVVGLANVQLVCFDGGVSLARPAPEAAVPRIVGNWPYGGASEAEFRVSDMRNLEDWREIAGLLPTSQSSIVSADGRLYFGDKSSRLYCVDAAQRGLVWSQQLDAPVIFPPALDDQRVYAAVAGIALQVVERSFLWTERHWYAQGRSILYAFDRRTGEVRWRHTTGFRTTPLISGGRVYFGGMIGYGVLDAATGKSVWIEDRPLSRQELPFWYVLGAPVGDTLPVLALRLRQREDPRRILRAEGDLKVLLVDSDTGQTRREIKLPRIPKSDHPFAAACVFSPALDRVTVAVGNGVRSYRLPEGTLLWERPLSGGVVPGAVREGTRWYLPLDTPGVACVDLDTGQPRWEFRQMTGAPGALVAAEGTLLLGALDSNLYALSADTGALAWKLECPGGRVSGAPVVTGDLLYAAASDGRLYAVVWRATPAGGTP